MKTTTAITTVKRVVQLREWTEQIKAQKERIILSLKCRKS